MKSIVCIKRVADTEARIRIGSDGRTVDPAGVKFVMNPYDEFALEGAIRHREAAGTGEVIALTVGGSESAETLRTALAMGADRAILLTPDKPAEGLAVARVIAGAVEEEGFDLVLFGMKAIDDDIQGVGAMVAELLDVPAATVVTEFEVRDDRVVADREIEGAAEVVELRVPCVLSITKGAYEPRYASLKGIMAAKKKPLDQCEVEVSADGMRVDSLSYPPERKAGRIVGEGPDAVPELLRVLREEAKVL